MKAIYETYERLPEAEKQCVPGFNFTSDQLFWVNSLNPYNQALTTSNLQIGYSFFHCTLGSEHERLDDYKYILQDSPVRNFI